MRTNDVETAKDLAKRLRSDLHDAGYEIPHSLALELVAHQLGARDWNVVAARGSRGSGEEFFVDVETEVLTVGQLRKLLSGVSDDTGVHSVHRERSAPSPGATVVRGALSRGGRRRDGP